MAPSKPVAVDLEPPRRSRWPLVLGVLFVGTLVVVGCGGLLAAGGVTAVVVSAPELAPQPSPAPAPAPGPKPRRPRR